VDTCTNRDLRFLPTELTDAATAVLLSYRKHCAAASQMGQLVLPEPLKLLPLYVNCLLKLPAFVPNVAAGRGAGSGRHPYADVVIRADRRAADLAALRTAPHHATVPMIYPRVYRVDAMVDAVGKLPPLTPAVSAVDLPALAPREPPAAALLHVHLPPAVWPSAEKIEDVGLYLVEAHRRMYLWVGAAAPEAVVAELFGPGTVAAHIPPGAPLPRLSTDLSKRVWHVIGAVRARRRGGAATSWLPLTVVAPAHGAGRAEVAALMVEDKTGGTPAAGGRASYVDLLCTIHTAIQHSLTHS
jgi:protein transport protein SEC24